MYRLDLLTSHLCFIFKNPGTLKSTYKLKKKKTIVKPKITCFNLAQTIGCNYTSPHFFS